MTPRQQLLAAVAGLRCRFYPRWDDGSIAGRGTFEPRFVMLHHTAGTHSLGVLTTAGNLTTGPNGGKVPGAHFLVNRDGSLEVLSRFRTYHAGRGSGFGVPVDGMNGSAWGIEIEDLGLGQTMTEAQIETTAILTAGLLRAMGRGVDAVIEHEQWSSTGKVDTRYPLSFWRDRVARHLTPPEDDMALSDTIEVPTWGRALIGKDRITVEEVLVRTLAATLRSEQADAAGRALDAESRAGLIAALKAVPAGATTEEITAAVDAAVARYLGGPIPAEVTISVAPQG